MDSFRTGGRSWALLALLGVAGALALGACRGNAAKDAAATPEEDAARSAAPTNPVPEDPRIARFQRVDLLISQWDAGQAEGRADQAQAVFDRVRAEVDGAYPDFVSAASGKDGVRLQYLGVAALGFSARPEATAFLVERLMDNDAHLVGNALIALKLRADPNTPLEPILRLVPTGAPEPKRYAPLALANVLEAQQRAGRPRDAAIERSAVHLLSGVVADRDPYVRLHVAKALGLMQSPGAYELLLVLLKDEHIRIRVAAAAGLERQGDPRGFPEVLRLLAEAPEETKPVVRDVLASYAERLQRRPLQPAEIASMATSPLAWHRWYQEWQARSGLVASAPATVPVSSPPVPAPFPRPAPAPAPAPRTTAPLPPSTPPPPTIR